MYRKRAFRRPRRKILRRGRRVKKGSSIRRMVKKMISRNQETKHYASTGAYTFNFQQTYSGVVSNTFSAIPAISNGTGIFNRVADTIHLSKSVLRIVVSPYLSYTGAKAIACRLIVFSLKDVAQSLEGNSLGSTEANNFFWSSSGSTGVTGYIGEDHLLPINTNRVRVHKDVKFIMGANIDPATNTANTACPNQNLTRHFTIPLKHMKRLEYDQNSINPNYPVNHSCYFMILCNWVDGSQGDNTTLAVKANWCYDYAFKDA